VKPDPTSLDRLHDLVLPPAAPWWPPAPAWYWVLGLLAVLALVYLIRALLHWQHNRYRREALHLATLEQQRLHNPATRVEALVKLGEILKRTAITAFPREQTASLTGPSWLAFLDRTSPTPGSLPADLTALETAAYDPRTAGKIDAPQAARLAEAVRDWLAHHRIPVTPRGPT
jgi:hypothetical protein